MKATIDFDDALYRRLKIEAARRGRTIRDLVADGVRLVLDTADELGSPPDASEREAATGAPDTGDRPLPPWFGALRKYAKNAHGAHDLAAMRRSVARKRPPRDAW